MFGLTTTRAARARIRARDERIGELLQQVDDARRDRDAFKYAAETASEKYTDTSIVNECLTEDLAKARTQLAEYNGRRTVSDVLEEHDVHRKAIADALGDQKRHLNWDQLIAEVHGWVKAANAWMADYEAEKKRADHLDKGGETGRLRRRVAHLEKQLDDATSAGDVGVPAGADWRRRPEVGA